MEIIIRKDYKIKDINTLEECVYVEISTKEDVLTPEKYELLYAEIEKIKSIIL